MNLSFRARPAAHSDTMYCGAKQIKLGRDSSLVPRMMGHFFPVSRRIASTLTICYACSWQWREMPAVYMYTLHKTEDKQQKRMYDIRGIPGFRQFVPIPA